MNRNIIISFLIILLFINIADATTVIVKGRKILVNGNPFFIKGVGYSPVPIGIDPTTTYPYGDYYTLNYASIYNRDLPLLRDMGTNTIRLWGWNNDYNHTDFLNNAYNKGKQPMYVIATFWMGPPVYPDIRSLEELEETKRVEKLEEIKRFREKYYPDITSIETRKKIKENFSRMVKNHKNNSAILIWSIGNELNIIYWDQIPELFTLINEMAYEAHAEDKNHPVTTPLADVTTEGLNLINLIKKYNSSMTHLDIWAVQLYRGKSFGTFFKDYINISKKPVIVSEYGIDSYNDRNHTEYQNMQASYDGSLWRQIKRNSTVTIGGSIMAYSDEWWKGKYGWQKAGCPDYDPWYHSECGYPTNSHPDGYSNEEWWGIMRVKDNGNFPDIVYPRSAYYTLKLMWTPPASITNLKNITYKRTHINWTWKDPKDTDFSKVMVYINGKFKENIIKGRQYYNATGLKNDTWYKISTHTVDVYGNINMTWVNRSAKTAK